MKIGFFSLHSRVPVHLGLVENGTQLILDQNSFSKSNEKLSFLNQCEFGLPRGR